MSQVRTAMVRRRELLAGIEGTERELQAARRQFRDHVERIVSAALYRSLSVARALSAPFGLVPLETLTADNRRLQAIINEASERAFRTLRK